MSFSIRPNGQAEVEGFPGLGVSVFQLRPRTQGEVTLRSANPADKAVCTPNFLTDQYDVQAMLSGLKQIREIMNTEPIRSRVVAEETPGPTVQTDDDWFGYMKDTGNTAQHTIGTCMMGAGPMAVVDALLRVRGLDRLRVIDASVMPHQTSGNTNAPAIMIGVKGGHMITEDALPRRSLPA